MVIEAPANLRDVLLNRAASDPDRLAYADATGSVTYGELAANVAAKAVQLQRMGVEKGDRVALTMSPGIALAEAFWALQMLGAASCVLNVSQPAATLRKRSEEIRARLVLDDGSLADGPAATGAEPETPRSTPRRSPSFRSRPARAANRARRCSGTAT